MHWFQKGYKSIHFYTSRQCSRHALKVDNYITLESRLNIVVRILETLIMVIQIQEYE